MTRSASFLMVAACALGGSFVAQSTLAQSAASPAVNDGVIVTDGMPRMLADFGFFADAAGTVPAPGLVPYELNTPLWSDGADKLRYLYVPEGSKVESDGDGLLQFPVGSAIIKTFAFGEGADQRYIETRVLLHRADGWIALPYRWNEEQTEARLALAGARVSIATTDGDEISYRIPNKNQCKSCHALNDAVMPIGPKARNLSSELLTQLVSQGRMDTSPNVTSVLPVWGAADGDTATQARAYLDVNCAHCHQPGGGASNSGLDLRWEQDDAFAVGVRKPPVAAGRGAGGLLVSIEPGNPDASILVHRMNSAEPGVAMPELGRSTIDHQAVTVMRDWIAEMDE
ncbi:MAG: SO2930 family diheme c-type cytochrome [Erythrobacter sp.]